jgi:hypothetical protein
MVFAATTALAIGASTYLSAQAAKRQNEAIENAMSSQQGSTIAAQGQIAERAGLERLKASRQAAQIEGKLRVAAAEAGTGIGGSFARLSLQNTFDEGLNQKIIQQNYENQIAGVRSGLAANLDQLESQTVSPILAAFAGGVSGLSTGLSIGNAFNQFDLLSDTDKPGPYTPVTDPVLFEQGSANT